MRRFIAVMMVVGLFVAVPVQPVHAEETGELVVTKLFRGIANLTTGWMEIIKQSSLTYQESGAGAGLTWGIVKGVGYAISRTSAGAFELITFPMPVPEGYVPLMQPEYVLSDLNK